MTIIGENFYIHLKPGRQHLNGYNAMGYVRFRHTDDDLMRAQRQHEFLEALRVQSEPPLLISFMRILPESSAPLPSNLKSNLTTDQLLTLSDLSQGKRPKTTFDWKPCPSSKVRSSSILTVARRQDW